QFITTTPRKDLITNNSDNKRKGVKYYSYSDVKDNDIEKPDEKRMNENNMNFTCNNHKLLSHYTPSKMLEFDDAKQDTTFVPSNHYYNNDDDGNNNNNNNNNNDHNHN